ncbi:MAG: DUF6125 family protein [Desulfotomaculaceae bacterium]|nr:DUF6125 family protein [Desulfotomaculaceae bacterium]
MKGNNPVIEELNTRKSLLVLLEDMAKRWLAHDGLWFQAVEKSYGLEEAIRLDAAAWEKFSEVEAKRIMSLLEIAPNGGLPALKKALGLRLYAFVNVQEIIVADENRFVFRMNDCRVQSARKRKNLPDFPCKAVGLVEYESFAKTIDSRIKTRCIACPPDDHPDDYYCTWEFSI